MSISNASSARPVVATVMVGNACRSEKIFSWKCSPDGAGDRPKKSFHCPTKMMTAIPAVKPTMTGFGMYLMTAPKRANPNATKMMPAIRVAICRPPIPCCAVMMDKTAMKAPVGPEI